MFGYKFEDTDYDDTREDAFYSLDPPDYRNNELVNNENIIVQLEQTQKLLLKIKTKGVNNYERQKFKPRL